jgi:uncharacterized protein (TIGR02284 family)
MRNDEIVAVDGVHRHLGRLMDGYLDAARLAHDPALARMFDSLAAERAAMRKHVGLLVMALGHEPGDGDPDRRALAHLARRVRALLRANHQPLLIRELERKEDALAMAIAAALAIELPERTASCLTRIRAAVDRARRQLAEARIELSHASPPSHVLVPG